MQRRYEEIRALGSEVVVVSLEPLHRLKKQVEQMGLPFLMLSDPELTIYAAYGVRRGSFRDVFNVGASLQFLKLLLKGRWVWGGHGDIMQMGGDFIIDEEGFLTYSQPAARSQDRAEVDLLIEELKKGRMPNPTA